MERNKQDLILNKTHAIFHRPPQTAFKNAKLRGILTFVLFIHNTNENTA